MTTIREALFEHLKADAGVAALVGTRIYPAGDLPRNARPDGDYITYQRISNVHEHDQSGQSGLAHPRYQFDCWSDTPLGANALGEALIASLDTYRGEMGAVGGKVTVRGSFVEGDRDDFEAPTDGSQRGPHRVIVDVVIWHVE